MAWALTGTEGVRRRADLYPTGRESEYQLVLSDAGPEMFWVDNAPGRYSDQAPMSYFFPQWDYLFGDDPPNAALFWDHGRGCLETVFPDPDRPAV